jgi:hypothetical protein
MQITDAREFVASAASAKIRRVMFQTPLWQKHEIADDDLEGVNLPRVSLIRRLKRELGSRFLGGLVPTQPRRALPHRRHHGAARRSNELSPGL